MSNFSLRPAQSQDIPEVMRLINELAVYEKAPEKVRNNAQQLLQDWQHGSFSLLVAEADGRVVGMSLFYPRYSTWNGRCYYLEDLYVEPPYRGQGMGLALIRATADEARKAGAKRLDWQVIDWNEPAVKFYEQLGATVEKEWWNCKWDIA
jgi:GNAT superfamily N-acetyltransferase